jgi:transcriptional antiterminator Rof (Rho-off)
MAKTKVDEWDTVPENNADVDGISILGTAPASNMDNALREVMSQIRATPLRQGAADMRTALGAQTLDATLTSLSGLSLAAGDVLYATAADTLARLPKGTAAQILVMNAGATAPEWSTSTAQASDATLTSLSGLSLAAGDVLYATAADTLARLPKGTAAQVLAMNAGATAPEWATSTAQTNEGLAASDIGQYVWGAHVWPNTGFVYGSTYAGSNVRSSGMTSADTTSATYSYWSAGLGVGTWRALGTAGPVAGRYSQTLLVRIA